MGEDGDKRFDLIDRMPNADEINTNKMVHALSSIALEMQKFHASTPVSFHNFGESQDLGAKLSLCKSNIRLKRKQIKLLKQNLRNACVVAKTVMSAKERETTTLHDYVNNARNDCINLYQKNVTNTETIQSLTSTNEALCEKIKHLEEFIELGYLELQKMRNVSPENIPIAMKLKEIIISCGQYYADYTNEFDTHMQLEQRNRFLSNKIKILVNNLEAVAEELKNLKHQNNKLLRENTFLKNKLTKPIDNSSMDIPLIYERNIIAKSLKIDTETVDHSFDLSSHLSLVKNLLSHQDNMLKDLKKLSEKLTDDSDATSELSARSCKH